jgi:glutamyl-tRNA reductase
MSVLVVGLSHRTAPLPVLERAALTPADAAALAAELTRGDHVAEAIVLATCNRLEIYAEVSRFHGGVGELGTAIARATGVHLDDLTEHLYVHYEGAAIWHLFSVACGLESMAVGEAQILGQVRSALRSGQEHGTAGRSLGPLFQHALRVGKRAHSETNLDRAGPSLVEAGLAGATAQLGPAAGLNVLVIGAGGMSGLAVASAARAGVARVTVVSRTRARADRLAASVGGSGVALADLPAALGAADVVLACAGARAHVVDAAAVTAAMAGRGGRPQYYVDLALPRDVDPAAAEVPGVTVVDLEALGRLIADASRTSLAADLDDVRALVADEASAFLAGLRAEAVAPTVVALRAMARSVVESELSRLAGRLGDVDERVRAELEQTVHRVVEKLLHTPTVKVKELAAEPGGGSYAEALRELFGLGPEPLDVTPAERVAAEQGDRHRGTRPGAATLDDLDPSPGVLR